MTNETNPQWSRHLQGIADELLHLAVACDVRLRDPGVVERVLKGDETVCGRRNEIGFQKLRKLLMATFDSLGKAIDRIGPEETREITAAITAELAGRRDRPQSKS
ncbi:MAG: hypothetical protein QNJ23_05230 [Woeseiaceae bacterium]|nr:hypothetical protein [Woeseiaceae bacterium]